MPVSVTSVTDDGPKTSLRSSSFLTCLSEFLLGGVADSVPQQRCCTVGASHADSVSSTEYNTRANLSEETVQDHSTDGQLARRQ